MRIFENRNVLEDSRKKGPRRLEEKTLKGLELIINKEMLPLDEEEVGENLGFSSDEISEDLSSIREIKINIKRENERSVVRKLIIKELKDDDRKEVLDYYERMGHVFEGFLYSNISESKIFKDVILHKTSEFDDIKNGVDFVAEYQNPDNPRSYIALAMDASFSMAPDKISKKIDRSIDGINKGRLSQVKYFEFEEGSLEKSLGMPRVVVGVEEDTARSLLSRWHTREVDKIGSVDFSEDSVWSLMALQINEQLKVFIDQAKSRNQKDLVEICQKYQRALQFSITKNRELIDRHKNKIDIDGVSRAIYSHCENLKKYQAKIN